MSTCLCESVCKIRDMSSTLVGHNICCSVIHICIYFVRKKEKFHSTNSEMHILTDVLHSHVPVRSFFVDNQMLLNMLVIGQGCSMSNPAL